MAKSFWSGFGIGAATGAGAVIALNLLGNGKHPHIVRLERSIQVGRPVREVFDAWSRLDSLPGMSHLVERIEQRGDRSHWVVRLDGMQAEWDAEVEQLIPGQAIGWKSVSGLKHTGRVNFAPLGNDTLVHIIMNYAPPGTLWGRPFVQPFAGKLGDWIERCLRDFKASLEGKGAASVRPSHVASRQTPAGTVLYNQERQRATGTFGATPDTPDSTTRTNPLGVEPAPNEVPVDFTRPPEKKY